MPKNATVKPAKATKRAKVALKVVPPRGDGTGPCSQLDQDLATLTGQLQGLLTLLGTMPVIASYPVYDPAVPGWVWEPL